MAHVVTENCIKCKFTDCASICPVSAFHEAEEHLVINPAECVDCKLCVHACSAHAIFHTDDLPEEQRDFVDFNARLAAHLPIILGKKKALPEAVLWNGAPTKRRFINLA